MLSEILYGEVTALLYYISFYFYIFFLSVFTGTLLF